MLFAFFQHIQHLKTLDIRYKLYVPPEQQSRDRTIRTENKCLKCMPNWQLLNYFATTFSVKIIKSCIKTTAGAYWNTW